MISVKDQAEYVELGSTWHNRDDILLIGYALEIGYLEILFNSKKAWYNKRPLTYWSIKLAKSGFPTPASGGEYGT